MTVYVDALGTVRAWINANVALTGGTAPPLSQGAHLKRLTPIRGVYAHLILISTTSGMTAESPISMARISATIYGGKLDTAEAGARAYANELQAAIISGRFPLTMGPARCVLIDNVTGPSEIDDFEGSHEIYRMIVDADFWLSP